MRNYEKVFSIFTRIYGSEVLAEFRDKLIELLENFAPPAKKDLRTDLSARDSILITYGDAIYSLGKSPLETLENFLAENVKDAFSAVHLLPFFPYSSDDGFSVIDFSRVDPKLGSWEDVDSLSEDYDLMFDAVINHVSIESEWFRNFLDGESEYADYFITVENEADIRNVFRPRALPLLSTFDTERGPKKIWTTFSEDQVDLNFHNPEVLVDIVRILLSFVEHGARFIRLDAIAYIWKEPGTECIHLENAHRIVQFFRAVFDCVAPFVNIITETNVPHEENISYFGDGRNEAQLVYNFSLPPLVLHAFHTQNSAILSRWAKSLRTPSNETNFFNFLASHDGVGVTPARGLISDEAIWEMCKRVEALGGFVSYKDNTDGSRSPYELNINYLDALGDPDVEDETIGKIADRFLASQSIMLALQGVPGIYYHSLLGSRSWKQGVDLSGRYRTINREKIYLQSLLEELNDRNTLRYMVFHGYLEMLRVRGTSAGGCFDPHARQIILDLDERLMSIFRQRSDGRANMICLTNLSKDDVQVGLTDKELPVSEAVHWHVIFSRNGTVIDNNSGLIIRLGPYGILWLLSEISD